MLLTSNPHPSGHCPEVCQCASSPYVPGTFQAAVPTLVLRGSASVRVHFKSSTSFSGSSFSWTEALLICTARNYGDFSSGSGALGGVPGVGAAPGSSEGTSAVEAPLLFLNLHNVMGTPQSTSACPLPVSLWFFLTARVRGLLLS